MHWGGCWQRGLFWHCHRWSPGGASQAQHKSNGTHLLTTHPSLPYPHHPPITSTPSTPTPIPRTLTTTSHHHPGHPYVLYHSLTLTTIPSPPIYNITYIILYIILPLITHHTLTYTSLCCFANHTLTTHQLYPSLQHPRHPASAPHYNTSPPTYSTPHPHPPTHLLYTTTYLSITTTPSPPTYCTPVSPTSHYIYHTLATRHGHLMHG